MAERPAPLVLVVDPATLPDPPFGSYVAVARTGQALLAAELSQRLAAQGAAVARLPAKPPQPDGAFRWGRWFAAAAADALAAAGGTLDAIGYASPGALALADETSLDTLLSPVAGEVVANNRYSADAFVVAGDLDAALAALRTAESDNGAVRRLEEAGFRSRDLRGRPWSRFDVDTPLDLALLRLATRLPGTRAVDHSVRGLGEMARLPDGRALEVPHLEAIGAVLRDQRGELLVAGRVPAATLTYLESETACRVRAFVEERGMRAARGPGPRSLLAAWAQRLGPADLVGELASLADAVIVDSRVVMAALAGSADAASWPPPEERFASDFSDVQRVGTPWLRELTEAAANASVPVLLGGHALVSDGLQLLTEAAWLGR
jgi:hypothetical protein